jgi:hypothetical protein
MNSKNEQMSTFDREMQNPEFEKKFNKEYNTFEKYNRKAIFSPLKEHCIFSVHEPNDFMEVTGWANGDGFDVEIRTKGLDAQFQITYGQFDLLKKLVKQLNK